MKYSFILPIYNVEAYLEECVESILMQTYSDYEIILVDDGSTDSSPMICDSLAKQDSRIKVIHKENGGLSDARNVGTLAATGSYIIYIDSDDFLITNDFLEKINNESKSNPDLIFYKYKKYYQSTKKYEECKYTYKDAIDKNSFPEKIEALVKADAFYGMAWIKTIKREILVKNNISFEVGLLGEDMDWNYQLMVNSSSISFIDEAFIAYRQREGSITATHKLKNLTDFIYILEKWSKRISNSEMDYLLKNAFLGSLAKYYSNMLVVYARLKDKEKKKYRQRIKDLSWLLNHSMSNRSKAVRNMYNLFGFNATILALQIMDLIK